VESKADQRPPTHLQEPSDEAASRHMAIAIFDAVFIAIWLTTKSWSRFD
jgi:hypothetical protein